MPPPLVTPTYAAPSSQLPLAPAVPMARATDGNTPLDIEPRRSPYVSSACSLGELLPVCWLLTHLVGRHSRGDGLSKKHNARQNADVFPLRPLGSACQICPPPTLPPSSCLHPGSPTWPGAMKNGRGFEATAALAITT